LILAPKIITQTNILELACPAHWQGSFSIKFSKNNTLFKGFSIIVIEKRKSSKNSPVSGAVFA
jgi:hypothetical protein